MFRQWKLAVEQLVIPTTTKDIRVLGFTSPHAGAGVSSLAAAAAETLTRSGCDVLLVDLASALAPDVRHLRAKAIAQSWREPVVDELKGYKVTSPADLGARWHFNNIEWLRGEFDKMLTTYSHIVVDLAPLGGDDAESVNALAAAAACEAVVLVCARQQATQGEVATALQLMRQANVNLIGTAINDVGYISPAEEVAAVAERWLPGRALRHRLAQAITESDLLR
jgi:Mrp family chromosome partitioning ATPase